MTAPKVKVNEKQWTTKDLVYMVILLSSLITNFTGGSADEIQAVQEGLNVLQIQNKDLLLEFNQFTEETDDRLDDIEDIVPIN